MVAKPAVWVPSENIPLQGNIQLMCIWHCMCKKCMWTEVSFKGLSFAVPSLLFLSKGYCSNWSDLNSKTPLECLIEKHHVQALEQHHKCYSSTVGIKSCIIRRLHTAKVHTWQRNTDKVNQCSSLSQNSYTSVELLHI